MRLLPLRQLLLPRPGSPIPHKRWHLLLRAQRHHVPSVRTALFPALCASGCRHLKHHSVLPFPGWQRSEGNRSCRGTHFLRIPWCRSRKRYRSYGNHSLSYAGNGNTWLLPGMYAHPSRTLSEVRRSCRSVSWYQWSWLQRGLRRSGSHSGFQILERRAAVPSEYGHAPPYR